MGETLEFLKQQIGKDASLSPSPLMRWLNPTILSVEKGKIALKYVIRHEMTNPLGNLHGGITAAIIDDAVGVTVFSLGETIYYTTLTNAIDYFSPVKEKESVIAETLIIKKGRQLINVQCEIWNADKSRLMARGYSNLIKIETPK